MPDVDINDISKGVQTNDIKVTLDSESVAVTGTFWQATQPVSAASLPLPSGAATSANQTTIIGHVDGIEGLLGTIDTDTGNIATDTSTIAGDTTSIDGKITACNTGAVEPGDHGRAFSHDNDPCHKSFK